MLFNSAQCVSLSTHCSAGGPQLLEADGDDGDAGVGVGVQHVAVAGVDGVQLPEEGDVEIMNRF